MAPDRPSPHPDRGSRAATLVGFAGRGRRAWSQLVADQRLAAIAAGALLVTMFLPWYQNNAFAKVGDKAVALSSNLSAFGEFSFVEAAVLLVAAGVSFLLFARAERRAFHLPGGDGTVIMVAGGWAAFLIFVRFFSKPGGKDSGKQFASTIGIQWGIFFALAAAIALAFAGARIRAAHRPEPALSGEGSDHAASLGGAPVVAPREPRRPEPGRGPDAPTRASDPDEAVTRVAPGKPDEPGANERPRSPDRLF